MATGLHDERLAAVRAELARLDAGSVADLGCGRGDLLVPLARAGVRPLYGLDPSAEALAVARSRLGAAEVTLILGSVTAPDARLRGIDVALMVEVVEHLAPRDLGALEAGLLGAIRPRAAVLTTPNAEMNALLGVPRGRLRHPGHRFEWTRAEFRAWAEAAALRRGYAVCFAALGGRHPDLGGASQMAVFERRGGP